VGIPDARTNGPRVTKKDRPLTAEHFAEFERCFGDDPFGRSKREESQSAEERWRPFSIEEVQERNYKIDSLKWLRDESLEDGDGLPEPAELATEAIEELEAAILDLNKVLAALENGNSQ
jgi:type I restriction enzyme M protein